MSNAHNNSGMSFLTPKNKTSLANPNFLLYP